jgi:hypothetical protein
MTAVLSPLLVRVRIPDLNPPDQGAIRLCISVCESERKPWRLRKERSLRTGKSRPSLARLSPN